MNDDDPKNDYCVHVNLDTTDEEDQDPSLCHLKTKKWSSSSS